MGNMLIMMAVCFIIYFIYMKFWGFATIRKIEKRGATRMLMAVLTVIERYRYIKNVHITEVKEEYEKMCSPNYKAPEKIDEDYQGGQGKRD